MDTSAPLIGELRVKPDCTALYADVEQRFLSGFIVSPSLDVDLSPGSILVLFGPSGAGKSTVLRQLAGLERPGRGTIRFASDTWFDRASGLWRTPQQRRVGVVSQESTLFPHLSVRDNIEYGIAERLPDKRVARSTELAAVLGVSELLTRRPRELSGGEVQRVAIARALAPAPRLMLLDEPLAALDAPTRARLRRDIRGVLHRTGTPAVLVTHDRTEALAMGDRIAVLIAGRVRQVGLVSAVFSHPADAEVAASLGVEAVLPARVLHASGGLLSVAISDVVLQVAERDETTVGSTVYACIRAEDVTLETQSPAHASTRNHLAATIVAVTPEGPVDRVSLDCGFPLDALITRRAREELQLAPGASITAAIKATSIHLVARYS
jgi:molybdate transport system ATP-binding protein